LIHTPPLLLTKVQFVILTLDLKVFVAPPYTHENERIE
jgi:hypothetical protein